MRYINDKKRLIIYQDKRWRKLSTAIRIKYPLCQCCEYFGELTPSSDTHHLNSPFEVELFSEEYYKRAFDPDNCVSLCKKCHGMIHDGLIEVHRLFNGDLIFLKTKKYDQAQVTSTKKMDVNFLSLWNKVK